MQSFQLQYSAYSAAHQSSTSKMLHLIGVPAMIIGLLMITSWFSIDLATKLQISFAWILVIAASIYYIMLDKKMGALAAVFYIVLALIVTLIAGNTPSGMKFVAAFVLLVGGFGAQYFGHSLEKEKPATKGNPMLIALIPLFFVYDLLDMSGFKSLIFKN
jgi:uncharacterized membrane protein YGL010W